MYLFQLVITARNCYDRTLTSCQHYQTVRFGKEVCDMANMKNQLWSPLFEHSVPPFNCPFHAVSEGLSAIGFFFFFTLKTFASREDTWEGTPP